MSEMGKSRRDDSPRVDAAVARRMFDEFEVRLARAAVHGNPRHVRALQMLGQALTRRGRHQEALEADLKLSTLCPADPVAFYNLACSYSNLDNVDAAFEALNRAFELGYNDYRHMLRDPDLEAVRRDRRFKKLLDKKWGRRQP
jgi:Flp pilus assembly protein TadD